MPPSGPPGSSADWSGSRPSPPWKLAPQYDQARTCARDLPSHRWPRGRWAHDTSRLRDRAVEVLTLLAGAASRAPSVPDLIIAATAELAGLTVRHLAEDFDVIADITGQPVERLNVR